jgi:hypothetical protein
MRCLTLARRADKRRMLAGLLAGLVLSGCTSSSSTGTVSSSPGSGVALEHPLLTGIPIPTGFELVPERSYLREVGQMRVANCQYEGTKVPDALNRFYKEYMPAAGFTLREERLDRGEYVMEFDSSAERSVVRFRREKFKTILIIDIAPASKGATEPDARPPSKKPGGA